MVSVSRLRLVMQGCKVVWLYLYTYSAILFKDKSGNHNAKYIIVMKGAYLLNKKSISSIFRYSFTCPLI